MAAQSIATSSLHRSKFVQKHSVHRYINLEVITFCIEGTDILLPPEVTHLLPASYTELLKVLIGKMHFFKTEVAATHCMATILQFPIRYFLDQAYLLNNIF